MKQWLKRHAAFLSAALSVTVVILILSSFTGMWPWATANPYRSYSLQANAWLQGRLDLGQDYPWLELAIRDGKYYVSFPPFPSMLLLPFAALFGDATPDALIAFLSAIAAVWYACALCRELGERGRDTLLWVLFLLLANGWLWLVMNGWVWFIAQNLCFTLLLMAIFHAMRGQGAVSLTAWACAVGCRPMTVLFFPLLAWHLLQRLRREQPEEKPLRLILRKWYWAAGPVLLAGVYMWLNWARFGSVLEFGHNYLPEFVREENGQFSLAYFADNFLLLFRWPEWHDSTTAMTWPDINGVVWYIVNPILPVGIGCWLCGIRTARGQRFPWIWGLAACLAYVFILCCHRTLGGWHFGNRYLLDLVPFVFVGILQWKPKRDWLPYAVIPLMALGTAVNLIGTVAAYNHWL